MTPVASNVSVELTQAGLEFLTAMFEKHDLDLDQALNSQEVISLFSTCPSMPWGPEVYNQVPVTAKSWIGLQGYLAWWNLISLVDPDKCCQLLAHLGYDYYTPHLPHKQPTLAKRQTNMTVFSCMVVVRDSSITALRRPLTFLERRNPRV